MNSNVVNQISECFVKPKHSVEESNRPYYLTPWDLSMLTLHYIQKGLLFTKPSQLNNREYSIYTLLESLKDSLSTTLIHFYPLAGQLSIKVNEDGNECLVFVDCNKGPGAKFIHASLDMTTSDLISPRYVPKVVHSLFDHDRAVNCDGLTNTLLTVQVTELVDGVFVGCSMNHAVVDGTSFWQFWNTWSNIHRESSNTDQIPLPHLHLSDEKFPFPEPYNPEIYLPFPHPNEIVSRYEAPELKARFFHFSSQVINALKSQANSDCGTDTISSFQALTAFIWKSIIKAIKPDNEMTNCKLATNNRHRLNPPIPNNYFGNCVNMLNTSTTVNELLEHDLGWTALRLNQLVVKYNDSIIRDELNKWLQSPVFYRLDMLEGLGIIISSSPRFNMYGNEFGLGKAVAVRSGYANKFPGAIRAYPGAQGGGSVVLEICLPPHSMTALESDDQFMNLISVNNCC